MQNNESQLIFNQIAKVFKRRKSLILLCVFGVLAPIIFFNEISSPIYEAKTMVVFEEFVGTMSNYGYDASREILIFNRLEEIKSVAFAEEVVREMPLEVRDKVRLPEDAPETFDKESYIINKLVKNIAGFPVSKSNIVQISVQWDNPYIAMVMANTAAQVLLERNYKIRQAGVSSVRKFVEEQLERVRDKLNTSEEALKNFKEENRITSFTRESEEVLRRLTEAEVLLNQVKGTRGSIETKLSTFQEKLSQQKQDIVPTITDIANPWAQKLIEKLVELQSELANLKVQGYSDSHPKIVQLNRDIEQTKKTLAVEAVKLVEGDNILDPLAQMQSLVSELFTLQVDLEAIKAQEAALKKIVDQYDVNLATLPEKEFTLVTLTRERDVNNNIFMTLLEKLEESKISEAEKITNIRIIDHARIPVNPVKPRKMLNIVIGVFLGFVLGVGLAFILEAYNKTLDSAEELENLTGWPVIASIPAIDKAASNGKFANLDKLHPGEDYIKKGRISLLDPKSGIAESYRMLRTNLQFQGIGQTCKTVLFTSIGPDEGKSTTLANLAISLANLGQNVLVVDADLRKPILHAILGIEKEPGLSELLVNYGTLVEQQNLTKEQRSVLGSVVKREQLGDLVDNFSDFVLEEPFLSKINNLRNVNNLNFLNSALLEAIQTTEIENLRVLASGKQLKNPGETISSIGMKTLLEELKSKYQIILIDSAPIMLVPETMILSSLVDGVIFVVDAKKYNAELLTKAKSLLFKAKANVLGAVLNNAELNGIYKHNYYYHA